jgi:hypothetical protein
MEGRTRKDRYEGREGKGEKTGTERLRRKEGNGTKEGKDRARRKEGKVPITISSSLQLFSNFIDLSK